MPVTAPFVTGTPQSFSFTATGTVVTYTGGGTANATTYDVLSINSDNTVTTPSGWTLATSRVVNQGAYIFYKSGGTTTATIDLGGGISTSTDALWVRITNSAGADSGATTVTGVDGSPGTSSFALTSAALSTSTELALMFMAGHNFSSAPTSPSWSSGYTEQCEATIGTGGSGTYGNVGVKTPAGTAAESPSVSWTNSVTNRYSLFVAFLGFDAGGTITPDGIHIPIALGSPSVSAAITVSPSGLAVPVALGAPDVGTGAVVTTVPGGSWWTLKAIDDTNIENARQEWREGPVACPNDGEPLLWDPRLKKRRCPYDGWISPR